MAPSVLGYDKLKLALLCQLVGGKPKYFQDIGKFRSDINILIVGDPGIAKSQLLKQVQKISSRSVYTTGSNISAAGLTAYVQIDSYTKEISIQPGALVQSSNGVCIIDEFDKLTKATIQSLNEPIDSQTISLAKYGVIQQIQCNSALLAAANPKDGTYNYKQSIVENINLSKPLLSRFDIVFNLISSALKKVDENVSKHILSMYQLKNDQNDDSIPDDMYYQYLEAQEVEVLKPSLLKQYLTFTKQFNPTINNDIHQLIVNKYIEMRQASKYFLAGFQISTRQLESIIRISEALARLKCSQEVTENDVLMAIDLIDQFINLQCQQIEKA